MVETDGASIDAEVPGIGGALWGPYGGGVSRLRSVYIGFAIVWATAIELLVIFEHGGPSIKDKLLLFIYVELAAMVGIYFKTKKLPVRFLIYIAITALTRVLAIDIKEMTDLHLVSLTGSILALCLAVLVLRFAWSAFPNKDGEDS